MTTDQQSERAGLRVSAQDLRDASTKRGGAPISYKQAWSIMDEYFPSYAVNERPDLLARIKRLEEAAYHLKLARDAWNFDQTVANFKILGDALDRVVALTE